MPSVKTRQGSWRAIQAAGSRAARKLPSRIQGRSENALQLPVNRRSGCRVCVFTRIHCCRNLFGMLGHHFTPLLNVGLHLGTATLHRLLAFDYVFAELIFAGIDIGVDLGCGFPRLLLQVLRSLTGQTIASFCSRLRSVKHTDCCTNSQSDQKPTKTAAASALLFVCHGFPLSLLYSSQYTAFGYFAGFSTRIPVEDTLPSYRLVVNNDGMHDTPLTPPRMGS
jgi:hypothetical protein